MLHPSILLSILGSSIVLASLRLTDHSIAGSLLLQRSNVGHSVRLVPCQCATILHIIAGLAFLQVLSDEDSARSMAALHRAETFVDTLLLVTDAQVNCQTRAPGMTTEGRPSDVEADQATQQVRCIKHLL